MAATRNFTAIIAKCVWVQEINEKKFTKMMKMTTEMTSPTPLGDGWTLRNVHPFWW
jgi:hypothetical protein